MHKYIQKDYQGFISSSHNPQGLWTLLHNTPIPFAKREGFLFHILTKNQSALSTCMVNGLGIGEQAEMDQNLRRKYQVFNINYWGASDWLLANQLSIRHKCARNVNWIQQRYLSEPYPILTTTIPHRSFRINETARLPSHYTWDMVSPI